jgi:threonine synthase
VQYVSTRGRATARRFTEILLEGLAPDGGLYVPAEIPRLDVESLRKRSYPELAFEILSRFMDDVPDLRRIVFDTYSPEVFGSAEVTPLRTLETGLHLLGLSNGPTLAFKDVALQLLGALFQSTGRKLNILGATSGDTGSAAEYALRGRPGIQVFMLSPHQRMSPFQRAQMYSLQDANIHNLAVRGVFDDCQDLVKQVNADREFKARHAIGAVNSINWARVAAQVVYYFKGYFAATSGTPGGSGEQVSFAVPTGNFGNIYAGYVARRMGLPIRRLILATNENDVLDEYFRSGRYRVRREVAETSSPSMDISKASNFERYAFALAGPAKVDELWRKLEERGEMSLPPGDEFVSGRSTHADRIATIRWVYSQFGVMIDPHTADGVKVGLEHVRQGESLICLETASPVKFAATLREALGREPERPRGFANLESLPQRVTVIGRDAVELKRFIASHA